jgi:hypothetical protein
MKDGIHQSTKSDRWNSPFHKIMKAGIHLSTKFRGKEGKPSALPSNIRLGGKFYSTGPRF